jgi:hypothetical protein
MYSARLCLSVGFSRDRRKSGLVVVGATRRTQSDRALAGGRAPGPSGSGPHSVNEIVAPVVALVTSAAAASRDLPVMHPGPRPRRSGRHPGTGARSLGDVDYPCWLSSQVETGSVSEVVASFSRLDRTASERVHAPAAPVGSGTIGVGARAASIPDSGSSPATWGAQAVAGLESPGDDIADGGRRSSL